MDYAAGIISAVSLSGVAALLTFLLASRRDRRQRLTQVEVSRLEDLRSTLAIFISLIWKKRDHEKFEALLAITGGSDYANKRFQNDYKKIEIDADIARYFNQVGMLIALSYQGRVSDLLMEAMEKGNTDGVGKFGTYYLNREWARILEGKPPHFSPDTETKEIVE